MHSGTCFRCKRGSQISKNFPPAAGVDPPQEAKFAPQARPILSTPLDKPPLVCRDFEPKGGGCQVHNYPLIVKVNQFHIYYSTVSEWIAGAAGAKNYGVLDPRQRISTVFSRPFMCGNRVFRPPPAAQSLISRNPLLFPQIPYFPKLFPQIPDFGPYFPTLTTPTHPTGGVSMSWVTARFQNNSGK